MLTAFCKRSLTSTEGRSETAGWSLLVGLLSWLLVTTVAIVADAGRHKLLDRAGSGLDWGTTASTTAHHRHGLGALKKTLKSS
jgi:hypothetical protein